MTELEGELPEKIILTASRYNGIQITLEAKFSDRWEYVALGWTDLRIDLKHGTATKDDVSDTLRTIAQYQTEDPVRYAASHLENITKLLEHER